MPDCEICGGPGADALCVRCGRVVCDQCFHGFGELCVECASRRPLFASSGGVSSVGLRMLGMLLIVFGLLITSMAFVVEGGEGVIVVFPFVFGNVGGWSAVILSIAFLAIFVLTSLLPWILVTWRSGSGFGSGSIGWELGTRESEVMEYMITIEVPGHLRRTIYVEGGDGTMQLRSSADESFHRSYRLPEGFEVDEYDHEYEGDYLLLKLILKRKV